MRPIAEQVALGLFGALAACKIEPIEELEMDELEMNELENAELAAIELPRTVQPLAMPAMDEAREAARWDWEPERPAEKTPRESMAAIGRDLVLPWWLLWRSVERAEAPQVVAEEPPVP